MGWRTTAPKKYKPKDDEVVVVCSPDYMGSAGAFPDNVHGKCVSCEEPVHWRPHNPEPSSKLCLDCASISMQKGEHIEVSTETLMEFFEWLNREDKK